jgi:hypothetical protein
MIQVVNSKHHVPNGTDIEIYIGRGSPLGNPYRINHRTTREEAIAKYAEYLPEKIKAKDKPICNELNLIWQMAKRGNVNLVCFCKPEACHGDVIKKLVEEKL